VNALEALDRDEILENESNHTLRHTLKRADLFIYRDS